MENTKTFYKISHLRTPVNGQGMRELPGLGFCFRGRDESCWLVVSYDGLSRLHRSQDGQHVHQYTCRPATADETGEINARRDTKRLAAYAAMANN